MGGRGLVEPVLAPGPHRLAEFHGGEGGRPVGRAVSGAKVAVMQLDFDQPPGQQFGGGEAGSGVQHAHRDLPSVAGELPGHGAQRHGRVGQVGRQLPGRPARISLDAGLPRLGAGVAGTILAGPHADQDVPHRVGVPGHVRQDVRPRPPR